MLQLMLAMSIVVGTHALQIQKLQEEEGPKSYFSHLTTDGDICTDHPGCTFITSQAQCSEAATVLNFDWKSANNVCKTCGYPQGCFEPPNNNAGTNGLRTYWNAATDGHGSTKYYRQVCVCDPVKLEHLASMGSPILDPTAAANAADTRQTDRMSVKQKKVADKLAAKASLEAARVSKMTQQKSDKQATLPGKKTNAKSISDKRGADRKAANLATDTGTQSGRKVDHAAALVNKQSARDEQRDNVYNKQRADWQAERSATNTQRQADKATALTSKQASRDQARLDAIASNENDHITQAAAAHKASADAEAVRQTNRQGELQAKQEAKAAKSTVDRKAVHDASQADQVVQYAANKAKIAKKKSDFRAAAVAQHSSNKANDSTGHGQRAANDAQAVAKAKSDKAQEDIDAAKARADSKVALGHARQAGSRRRGTVSTSSSDR